MKRDWDTGWENQVVGPIYIPNTPAYDQNYDQNVDHDDFWINQIYEKTLTDLRICSIVQVS